MNFISHLQLYKRNWLLIIISILVVTGSSLIFATIKQQQPYESTIFLSIGTNFDSSNISSNYDNTQAADQFSETLQGWFKNPDLISRIEDQTNEGLGISARKQEKQNIVITYSSSSIFQSDIAAISIKNELIKDIAQYNQQTNENFQIALFTVHTKESLSKITLFIPLGIILGLILGFALSYFYEYALGFASHSFQIEKILEKKSDDILSITTANKRKLSYLKSLLLRNNKNDYLVIGINHNPTKLSKKLVNNKYSLETISFPDDSEILAQSKKTNYVLISRLGKTKLSDIQRIKPLLDNNYILVTLY